MKTAGELLKEKRQLKELTILDLAQKIKVKPEYLKALENSQFSDLPTVTTTKGFLRNYASALHLNPDTIVAMFRRDFESHESGDIIPQGLVKPVVGKLKFINANLILALTGALFFVAFLFFQLISWWSLPKLDLLQPISEEVYGEKVTVKGLTDQDATIQVNSQQVIVDQNGQFTLDLLFPAGTHSVIIQAENRRGKARIIKRTFQVTK